MADVILTGTGYFVPILFTLYMKGPFDYSRHLQASYNERVGFGSVDCHDLAVLDREVVEGVTHGLGIIWFVFEADQGAILKQKEVPCSPIFNVFSWKAN